MADFRIIYYILIVMFVLLTAVFTWGWITYSRSKAQTKFFNTPLLTATLTVASIGLVLTFVPIFMQIWEYDSEIVKHDSAFIAILVLEFLFLAGFLALAYIFAFDYGIAVDPEEHKLQFFGQAVNTNKIIDLVEKKYSLKIVYEQGFKNLKKKISIYTPKAKLFVKNQLSEIVATNKINKVKSIQEQEADMKNIESDESSKKDNHQENIKIESNIEKS